MRKECGEGPDLSVSLRLCTSTDTVCLEYISGFFYRISVVLAKLFLCSHSFVSSLSILVADTLEEGP